MPRQPGQIKTFANTDMYVPTFACPAFVSDPATTNRVVTTGFEGLSACFIDRAAGEALARVVTGPIETLADLEAAEAALQAIVFHDHISIIAPAVMNRTTKGESVHRFDTTHSNALETVLAAMDVSDQLVIVEHVATKDGIITQTNLSDEIVGTSLDDVADEYLLRRPLAGATLSQLPSEYRLPAYFAAPDMQNTSATEASPAHCTQLSVSAWRNVFRSFQALTSKYHSPFCCGLYWPARRTEKKFLRQFTICER